MAAKRRLTREQIEEIENALEKGESQRAIAKKYNVSSGMISNISAGIVHPIQDKKKPIPVKHDPTNTRILELEGQVLTMRDDLNQTKAALRVAQKNNAIYQALAEVIRETYEPLEPLSSEPTWQREDKGVISEHLVMHLSDEHADQIVLPHRVGNLERYSLAQALARAERYVDTTLQFTQETLVNYRFPVLWVLAYGDHTSGEIHGITMSEYHNQIRNSLAIGQMHALMFRDLAPYFQKINVVYVPGNHGRRSKKKDYEGAWDNWDYLIGETAKICCQNHNNINFLIPDSFSINLNINGHGFNVSHGDDIPSWNSLPWYGIERKTRRLVALHQSQGLKVKYFVMGHFHKASSLSDLDGEVIINGPWIATTPYIFERHAGFTEPCQWLHGVHQKYGISWRLKVHLRSKKQEPERYQVVLAQADLPGAEMTGIFQDYDGRR